MQWSVNRVKSYPKTHEEQLKEMKLFGRREDSWEYDIQKISGGFLIA
jgi:hypothetical protein